MKLVINTTDGSVSGSTNDPTFAPNETQTLLDAPPEFDMAQAQDWSFDGAAMVHDLAAAHARREAALRTPYMSHFGFLGRFTPQQRLAIRSLTSQTNANYDPILDDAMFLFNSAERIDVTLTLTKQLVGYMASIGLVPPEQIPALLAPILLTDVSAKP